MFFKKMFNISKKILKRCSIFQKDLKKMFNIFEHLVRNSPLEEYESQSNFSLFNAFLNSSIERYIPEISSPNLSGNGACNMAA